MGIGNLSKLTSEESGGVVDIGTQVGSASAAPFYFVVEAEIAVAKA